MANPPTVNRFSIFNGDVKEEIENEETVPEQPLHEQGPFESLLPETEEIKESDEQGVFVSKIRISQGRGSYASILS